MDPQREQQIEKLKDSVTQGLTDFAVNNKPAIKSTREMAGDTAFDVNVPDVFDAADLDNKDSLSDIQANLDASGLRVKELSDPSQQEIELGADIQKQDLKAQEAQRNLYGQGMGTPLSLLQGEQRKMQEQRSFERAFDMMELDLLEASRARELKVAQGELTQAQAEAEQLADTIKVNDSVVERIGKTFQGSSIAEIQAQSPETYSKLIESLANSNYTLGELEQALKAEPTKLQYRNVGGNVVALDEQGNIVKTIGKSSTGSSSSSTGSSSVTSGNGVSVDFSKFTPEQGRDIRGTGIDQYLNTQQIQRFESLPGVSIENAGGIIPALEQGIPFNKILTAVTSNPKAIGSINVATASQVFNSVKDDLKTLGFFSNNKKTQALIEKVQDQGYLSGSEGKSLTFMSPQEVIKLVQKLEDFK